MTSGPLRVALVYDDSLDRPGGVAQHVLSLHEELIARGHQAQLLVGQSEVERVDVRSLSQNVSARFNGNRLTVPLLASGSALDDALNELRPDVVHVQLPYSPLLAGRLIRRADSATAVVGTAHVFSERPAVRLGARALSLINRRTDRRFDRVLAVSDSARTFAERHSRTQVDDVVPNMVDVARLRRLSEAVTVSSRPTVAFVGSLVPRKGVRELLDAWPQVVHERPDALLIIAGDGPLRATLERHADRLAVARSVVFEGQVTEARKARLMAASNVACFPSLYGESFGIVLLEAMAVGTPVVIGGDNAGYREVLSWRDSCVDPRDSGSLARALVDGLADARCGGLRHHWQARRAEQHDVRAVVDELLLHYRAALRARREPVEQQLSDGLAA